MRSTRTPAPRGASDGLGPGLLAFLRDLRQHNDREWFAKNKARYLELVQEPALGFIRRIGPGLNEFSSHLSADPRPVGGSLSRIYRDLRFAKDKSPYKTSVGIHFPYRRHGEAEHLPGFYLHLSPGDSMVASGVWQPAPPALRRIRERIVARPAAWAKVLGSGLALGGESLQRVPSGFAPDQPHAEDLKRKDFTASLPISDAAVGGPQFDRVFLDGCRKLDPLNRFVAEAMGLPWA